jgi:hypothetical protein
VKSTQSAGKKPFAATIRAASQTVFFGFGRRQVEE